MKRTIISLMAATLIFALSSCNGKEQLAEDVMGTWASAPTQLETGSESSTTIMRTFHVTKAEDKAGGDVFFEGLVTITSALTSDQGFLQATTFSASGMVNARGTWEATDDDEITVRYDPASVTASFGSDAVLLPNVPFEADSTAVNYRQMIAHNVEVKIKNIFADKAAVLLEIDDIEMSADKQTFVCEVNDKKYEIRRQSKN